jgi:hypothetical protein
VKTFADFKSLAQMRAGAGAKGLAPPREWQAASWFRVRRWRQSVKPAHLGSGALLNSAAALGKAHSEVGLGGNRA